MYLRADTVACLCWRLVTRDGSLLHQYSSRSINRSKGGKCVNYSSSEHRDGKNLLKTAIFLSVIILPVKKHIVENE